MLIVLLVFVFIVTFVIPMARKKTPEAFDNSPYMDPVEEQVKSMTRNDLIQRGQQLYNKFSDIHDVRRPTFIRSEEPEDMKRTNLLMQQAMRTTDIKPKNNIGNKFPNFMEAKQQKITNTLPPPNGIIPLAKKCETLKTRDSCAKLTDPAYKYCGVCIDEGTTHKGDDEGQFIGGLLILPDDRTDAEDLANETGNPVAYVPTIGKCPPNRLFIDSNRCTVEANRLNCFEIGKSGGFATGKTKEGKNLSQVTCAQVPAIDPTVFVFNPKDRKYIINLRILTPVGTGMSTAIVLNDKGVELVRKPGILPGIETVVSIPNVMELMQLDVVIAQEMPLRKSGLPEVFLYNPQGALRNEITSKIAPTLCSNIGATIATKEQLNEAWKNGAQVPPYATQVDRNTPWTDKYSFNQGFTSDGILYPTQSNYLVDRRDGPYWNWYYSYRQEKLNYDGKDNALHDGKEGERTSIWCYGIKPPSKSLTTNRIGELEPKIWNFFTSFADKASPAQSRNNIWSMHENDVDYQGPLVFRGVLLQWEMIDDATKRTVPFEPTIQKVNTIDITQTANRRSAMKRLGTFKASNTIPLPKPSTPGLTNMYNNVQWLWGQDANSQTCIFTVKVPGTLMNPVYSQDEGIAARGPLINNQETSALLKVSACLAEGQNPGKYSQECLMSLFTDVGGNPDKGKLVTEGGIEQLNSLGDVDSITSYLFNLYSYATTGMDANQNKPIGTTPAERQAVINDASQKLFGFDIASPCEEIVETKDGSLMLREKDPPFPSACLNYLWTNTGSDKSRYESTKPGSTVQNTYTRIQDRFSGLMNNEGRVKDREKYPFQTCQPTGTAAPVVNGKPIKANVDIANAQGTIRGVQDMYNSIHQNANYNTNVDTQEKGMMECYGIEKAPIENKDCVITARYVRILPTALQGDYVPNGVLTFAQIQVFDSKDKEVAKDKQVYESNYSGTAQEINNGNAFIHDWSPEAGIYRQSYGECGGHVGSCALDTAWVMIDLGKMTNISKVIFYRGGLAWSIGAYGSPIQLLDDKKKVVAQKLSGSNLPLSTPWWKPEELLFGKGDMTPKYSIKDVMPGLRLSLKNANHWSRMLSNVVNAQARSMPPDQSALGNGWIAYPEDAGLWSKKGALLATLKATLAWNGLSGYVSFESAGAKDCFLSFSIGSEVCAFYNGGALAWGAAGYDQATSWEVVPALNGNPSMVSFKSALYRNQWGYPNKYLCNSKLYADGQNSPIYVQAPRMDSFHDLERFCWTICDPLA
jgi:hypothetical protein